MTITSTGTAPKLLSMVAIFGLLIACGQQPASVAKPPAKTPQAEIDEVDALIAATKQHPSLVNAAQNAGPPIHVDPNPKSNGMAHHEQAAK